MLRHARLLRHQRRDKAGNAHNFASDTLTRVYRDAVYAPQQRYRGNPLHALASDELQRQWSGSSSTVTNHVGNLGVMSARAAELRARDAHGSGDSHTHAQHHHHHHHDEHEYAQPQATMASSSSSSSSERVHAVQARRLHSGVQVEILSLYRALLREVARMRDGDTRVALRAYIRTEFDKHVDIPRRAIAQIEWRLTYAKRKLEELRSMRDDTRFSIHT